MLPHLTFPPKIALLGYSSSTADEHFAAVLVVADEFPDGFDAEAEGRSRLVVDPKLPVSDVEQAIQRVVEVRNDFARYELRAAEAPRVEELNELRRLEAEYGIPPEYEGFAHPESIDRGTECVEDARSTLTIQMKLF